MSTALVDLLETAAAIIDGEALCLRQSHTLADAPNDWGDDLEARISHNQYRLTAHQLYQSAEEMRRKK